jgi:hypothetical protein
MRRVACFCVLTCWLVSAMATTVRPPSFEELVDQSKVVFRGTVLRMESRWTGEGHKRRVATSVVFPELTLEFIGGAIGGYRVELAGQPRFSPGDRGVFFVENQNGKICPLLRLGHGRYRVERATGGVERVARDDGTPLRRLTGVADPLHADTEPRQATAEGGLTLGEFEQAIVARANSRNREASGP